MNEDDRRSANRFLACFPAVVHAADAPAGAALIRNLSSTGAKLMLQSIAKVGDTLDLELHISVSAESDELKPHVAKATVVRCEKRPANVSDIWPYLAAVEFTSPQEDLQGPAEQLEKRQAHLNLEESQSD